MQLLATIRKRAALFSIAVVTCLIGLVPLATPAGATAAHYYLALGDSYPYGYQPNGDWSDGYTNQLSAKLQLNDPNFSLVNMACWGETTATFINGGCVGPSSGIPTKVTYTGAALSQLDTAKAFLQTNGSAVKLVTLDVGLNDVVDACFNPHNGMVNYACVSQTLPTVYSNETYVLSTLKSVASSNTKFMIANTFDAFQNVLPNTIQAVQEFNQTIAQVASATNTPLVGVADAFYLNQYPNGNNPYLCPANAPLVWACTTSDTHPTTAGYTVTANAFYAEYESL